MMGADLFRTLHVSFHHLGKLLIYLIFSAHKAPLSLIPSRRVYSCIEVWINIPLEKKSCFLTVQNGGRLTSRLQSLRKVFSQSSTTVQVGSDSGTIGCLLGNWSVSKAAFFRSSFFQQTYLSSQNGGGRRNLHSRELCKNGFILFWPILRKRAKAGRIALVWECWIKACPTLALPYNFWSGPKGKREGKIKVVKLES